MSWVKIDDCFYDNTRNRALGPAARDLFVASLCYCAKGLTDGRIDKIDVPLLLAQAQAKQSSVQALVDAGRWLDCDDHYQVDGYLLYNPSREQVMETRAKATERQQKWRDSRAKSQRDKQAKSQGESRDPRPGPTPRSGGPGDGFGSVAPSFDPDEEVEKDTELNLASIRAIRSTARPA